MKIMFVCKHNLFRSVVAEQFFKKMNKNPKYKAVSGGVIIWKKEDLKFDAAYIAEKKVAKKYGIDLTPRSKSTDSHTLKSTDLIVIVADDVNPNIFRTEKAFSGKVLSWKIKDVKTNDKNKEQVAERTIKFIQKKVSTFVNSLK